VLVQINRRRYFHNLHGSNSDPVDINVCFSAILNVEEFLCPVWEIAVLTEERINMNSQVAKRVLHSTRRVMKSSQSSQHH
jgi:hypothetical protein